jgi:signal transduction histidine kinase
MIDVLAVTILSWLSAALGVMRVPAEADPNWQVEQSWDLASPHPTFEAVSNRISELCAANPSWVVVFPAIVQTAQQVWVNDVLVVQSNSPDFKSVSTFYGSPQVSCSSMASGSVVRWRATSFTRYFARFTDWPRLGSKPTVSNVFAEGLHTVMAGGLLVLGMIAALVLSSKIARRDVFSLAGASFLIPVYLVCMMPSHFGVSGDMLRMHKVADIFLWFGVVCIFRFLDSQLEFPRIVLRCFFCAVGVATVFIVLAETGDGTQLGTTIPFLFAPAVFLSALDRGVRNVYRSRFEMRPVLVLLQVLFFCFSGANDILYILGVVDSVPLMPVGLLGILLLAVFAVENQLAATYRERDYLRLNLESEVKAKTESLQQALSDLKAAQAEVLQSSKLASIGTLAAGIAHEINNSLNYVNGAVPPLVRIVAKEQLEQSDRDRAKKLFGIMQEGLSLTAQIIKNLKSFSRSEGTIEAFALREITEGVLRILNHKIRGVVQVVNEVDAAIIIESDRVALSQILLNLIDNAIDAMATRDGERLILFRAGQTDTETWICIQDNGSGIPSDILNNVFDPFFTTKPVGKGTGLGLYIVNNEVKKFGGNVKIESELGKGTEFRLEFPRQAQRAAA